MTGLKCSLGAPEVNVAAITPADLVNREVENLRGYGDWQRFRSHDR
jgi:hypothetical protein